jgi:hypothetical protein
MNKPLGTQTRRTSALAGQIVAENFAGWNAECPPARIVGRAIGRQAKDEASQVIIATRDKDILQGNIANDAPHTIRYPTQSEDDAAGGSPTSRQGYRTLEGPCSPLHKRSRWTLSLCTHRR